MGGCKMKMTTEQQALVREKVNHFMVGHCLANPDFLKELIVQLNMYKWPQALVEMLGFHLQDKQKVIDYLGFDPYAKSD